jgi:hypothetical protein
MITVGPNGVVIPTPAIFAALTEGRARLQAILPPLGVTDASDALRAAGWSVAHKPARVAAGFPLSPGYLRISMKTQPDVTGVALSVSFDEPDDEPNGAAIRAAVDALISCLADSGVA